MANLENLIAGHAYWSDKKRELKDEGSLEAGRCDGLDTCEDNHNQIVGIGETCIQATIDELNSIRNENPHNYCSFDEIWDDKVAENEICKHCINVRKLKKERTKASRRLGAIRAAMTKAGRKLEYKP